MSSAGMKLDSVSIDNFLGASSPADSDSPSFDLSETSLITPAAMVQIAATCYALARDKKRAVVLTGQGSVRSYLARSSFLSVVAEVATVDPEIGTQATLRYGSLRGTNPMLIEVTRIEDGSELPDLLDQIVWVLRYRLKYRKRDAFDVVTAISETCQNTFDHNHGTSGFLAMQVYGRGASRFLEIGVSDYGDGLTETLRRNPKNGEIASDLAAIKLATELGSSEHDDPTRGTGLYHLLEITYKHEGSVQIKSGNGKVRYRMDKRKGWAFRVPSLPGVHVSMTLPAKVRS